MKIDQSGGAAANAMMALALVEALMNELHEKLVLPDSELQNIVAAAAGSLPKSNVTADVARSILQRAQF